MDSRNYHTMSRRKKEHPSLHKKQMLMGITEKYSSNNYPQALYFVCQISKSTHALSATNFINSDATALCEG